MDQGAEGQSGIATVRASSAKTAVQEPYEDQRKHMLDFATYQRAATGPDHGAIPERQIPWRERARRAAGLCCGICATRSRNHQQAGPIRHLGH